MEFTDNHSQWDTPPSKHVSFTVAISPLLKHHNNRIALEALIYAQSNIKESTLSIVGIKLGTCTSEAGCS